MPTIRPEDEARHRPDADDLWEEAWDLNFCDKSATVGGFARLSLLPDLGRAWFWAALVGVERDVVIVQDHEVSLPKPPTLEVRAPGLWAELACLVPLDHMTVQLEAFGLRLDDPAEMVRSMRGDQVPFGLDLEWETEAAPAPMPRGYSVGCAVFGEVLLGEERINFAGFGSRSHTWGVRDWWSEPWRTASARLGDGVWVLEHEGAASFVGDAPPTARRSAQLVATVALPVLSPTGRLSHVTRTLARFDDRKQIGVGWVECNQPQPA